MWFDGDDSGRSLTVGARRHRSDSSSSKSRSPGEAITLVERLPHSNRYQAHAARPTSRRAVYQSSPQSPRTRLRLARSSIPSDISRRPPLLTVWWQVDHALDELIGHQPVAA